MFVIIVLQSFRCGAAMSMTEVHQDIRPRNADSLADFLPERRRKGLLDKYQIEGDNNNSGSIVLEH